MQFISKKNLIFVVSGLLMTGAGIYAAQWKWHFWQSTPQNSAAAPVAPFPTDNVQVNEPQMLNNAIGVREVLSAHLFGQEGEVKKAVNTSAEAPKTQQPLELHGIVLIPNHPERAVALIAQVGGVAKNYTVGDAIESLPGWKVLEILPNAVRIGLEEPGEILSLPAVSAGQSDNPSAMNPNLTPTLQEEIAPPPDEIPPTQDELLPPDNSQVPAQETPPPEAEPAADAPAHAGR